MKPTAVARRQVRRTLKYLCGILRGKRILDDTAGISDSCDRGHWLPEEPYLVRGDSVNGYTDAPMRAQQASARGKAPPFTGSGFYLHGDFSGDIQRRDVALLCNMGDGTLFDPSGQLFPHPLTYKQGCCHQHNHTCIPSSLTFAQRLPPYSRRSSNQIKNIVSCLLSFDFILTCFTTRSSH
ncbi:predicted protein [Lichtheimia corymbifera JMRC:FSU:9682]|uniref:Uncharacterized protein n=1 Tax=Lichtheimia corymbifera JMRC:FSU:9682 TaxID=1263082 RepID=A0A068S016_9FUNG|nr:predicted protein [Lichtheimia corymbifera JMRC:FSU:9682]